MNLEEIKRIAAARTEGANWLWLYNEGTENDAKFASMASNHFDELLKVFELAKQIKISCEICGRCLSCDLFDAIREVEKV